MGRQSSCQPNHGGSDRKEEPQSATNNLPLCAKARESAALAQRSEEGAAVSDSADSEAMKHSSESSDRGDGFPYDQVTRHLALSSRLNSSDCSALSLSENVKCDDYTRNDPPK